MDHALLLKAVVLGIVEGFTEFLPVSSTGHLIIAGQILGFNGDSAKVFMITIQLAAIFAVCWEYRVKLGRTIVGLPTDRTAQRFAVNLAIAFTPAAVLGVFFHGAIKEVLFAPVPVATALVVGGLVILWVERRRRAPRVAEVDDMRWSDALKVGCAQALALIPGTSRSGATIIGGLVFGLSRKAATEFSFFLAIPTMFAAVLYDLYKSMHLLSADDLSVFAVGFAASFVSAFIAVRGLLRYIARHDYSLFAWYRIGFGAIVLLTAAGGLVDWTPD
jgi:undecaprenyl-diphosphatase